MSNSCVSGLEHLYLEDSYFLGITAEGANLRLKVLFALTGDHPRHEAPLPSEQHCYRQGSIIVEGDAIREWIGKATHLGRDADRQIDFGSIEVFGKNRDVRIETEMFILRLNTGALTVELD
jgi:hypothetical protein